jgi:hypothetical protein
MSLKLPKVSPIPRSEYRSFVLQFIKNAICGKVQRVVVSDSMPDNSVTVVDMNEFHE